MKALFWKEIKSLFSTMMGYVFIAFFLLIAGIYVMVVSLLNGYSNFENVIVNMSFVYLLLVPILTMRAVAEERRQKSDRLLYALPVNMLQVVLGKYLAMLTILFLAIGVLSVYPLILSNYGAVSFLVVCGTVIAFFFLGAALIAVGLFLSSLAENQFVSAVLCFGTLLTVYLLPELKENLTLPISLAGAFGWLISQMALFEQLEGFAYGIFNIHTIVLYITICVLFVSLSIFMMERRRGG